MKSIHQPIAKRKRTREIRLPIRYRQDVLPEPARPVQVEQDLVHQTTNSSTVQAPAHAPAFDAVTLLSFFSQRNVFGIKRKYTIPAPLTPTHDPDQVLSLWDLTDIPQSSNIPSSLHYGPFSNKSSFWLADWYWHSQNKSFNDFQSLVRILKDPDFSLRDAIQTDWKYAFKALGANKEDLPDTEGDWIQDDGWKSVPISIDIPFHNRMQNPGTHSYLVGHLRCRSILSIIKEKLKNPFDDQRFHYYPYHATWKPAEHFPEVDLYGELYTSQQFRDAHDEVQRLPSTPENSGLERVVIALMVCFKDYLKELNGGKVPSEALFTYCHREKLLGEHLQLLRLNSITGLPSPLSYKITALTENFSFRSTPTFGRDTIRKFGTNASEMKRKAARDFEDLLQCSIPAFESLLPEPHNGIVMKLLFIFAQWHALAKLRLHNDFSLQLLEYWTTLLGSQVRLFDQKTCSTIATKELAKEAEARARRESKNNKGKSVTASRKPATLGIYTIKFHFLGDYASMIRRFGTSDSYSTEIVSLFNFLIA
ncbi:hypothetical protein EST38_g6 [Candolleomyces aberdarensis]|uniref:Uncharacterized protein n=1 Tax=Candolleomyces aberdarensis TaxID=2316362 RepID=A0A4Q2E0X2_9AGAR|nr:hypothetical protein EST38_g6 [Candolleomyces aberdarensis]